MEQDFNEGRGAPSGITASEWPLSIVLIQPGAMMKKPMLSLAAIGGLFVLLTGCVAVPVSDAGVYVTGTARSGPGVYPHDHGYPRGHGRRRDWDRDRDGVPNRHDRRPNNPYRY